MCLLPAITRCVVSTGEEGRPGAHTHLSHYWAAAVVTGANMLLLEGHMGTVAMPSWCHALRIGDDGWILIKPQCDPPASASNTTPPPQQGYHHHRRRRLR
ncbi:hypothetical protein E2C01_031862 [Portunus trituberculatus]|uniref:Uncharacterized protein n=1 Tax=Portunus trituberculatus TaxID=210409 RepID=A0A5B7EYT4_PORTR|nr:hypothetical protein [Portunus trituberculatus]